MIVHPSIGQRVQCWYRESARKLVTTHGKTGVVKIVARGPGPRNHGVEIDGELFIVPCGNLRKIERQAT